MVSMILFSVAVFERSLVDTFSSGSDYLKMWTAYCDQTGYHGYHSGTTQS